MMCYFGLKQFDPFLSVALHISTVFGLLLLVNTDQSSFWWTSCSQMLSPSQEGL